MKKYLLLLAGMVTSVLTVQPCTTFVLKTKNGLFFGRNLDWVSDLGLIIINQRNVEKNSLVFEPEKPIAWTSQYGSLTFNQFGKEFPFGGINEKGLVIEIMVSDAEYPEPDERPVVNELQWVQYQLDNCASVAEVIRTDSMIRIGQTYERLHYLVCDAEGNAAVIEFLGGKMRVYQGEDLPVAVLENESYDQSLNDLQNNKTCRFSTAANMLKSYKGNSVNAGVEYSFKILEKVALSAEWSIVYDIKNGEIFFRTTTIPELRNIHLHEFDFTCSNGVFSYDLSDTHQGDIGQRFSRLNTGANTDILKKALELNAVKLENAQSNQLFNYFKTCSCRK